MAELPATFYVHKVKVQTLSGSGAYGDQFAAAVEVPAWIEETRRVVRGADGAETLSEATIRLPLSQRSSFTTGSLVELHTELAGPTETARVISTKVHSDGGLGAWQHLEVAV